MKESKNSTIYDVAADAGVSPATVSRVINQTASVAESTRVKVLASMERLNFVQKKAEPIKGSAIKYVVVCIPTTASSFHESMIKSIRNAIKTAGYSCLLLMETFTQEIMEREKALLQSPQIAGFITITEISSDVLTQLDKIIPVVTCDCSPSDAISSVAINNMQAAEVAVDHLFSAGRKKIAFLSAPLTYPFLLERLDGYKQSLKKHTVEFDPSLVMESTAFDLNSAYSAAIQLLQRQDRPDAIFACSDIFASAIIRAAYANGLQIPRDLMVIGFDNNDTSALTVPALTTISSPCQSMGVIAVDMLIEKIKSISAPVRHILLDTELIVRESTRC